MHTALAIATFLIRHGLALGALMLFGATLWTGLYFGLLIFAIVTDGGIGSPLTYPLGLLAVVILTVICGLLFIPACASGRIFTYLTGWRRLAGIPVVFLTAYGLFLLAGSLLMATYLPEWAPWSRQFLIWVPLPLGIYWWGTEGPGAILDLLFARWRKHRSRGS